jgi:murein DD-endopeptidase MepM/ murein hydrolase activator NlpD
LSYAKLRGPHRGRAEPERIDLGEEPPLSVDGAEAALIDRKRISLRWYAGTILNGLCGAALMGGAVYVALDGEAFFAAIPEHVESLRAAVTGDRTSPSIRKTDRLPTAAETHSARQMMRVSTTVMMGERQVVRVRPLVRIAANLSLSTSDVSANVPRYSPGRIMTASANEDTAAAEETPRPEDGDISFVVRDLAPLLNSAKMAAELRPDDVLARVRQAANWTVGTQTASLSPGDTRMAYAAEGDIDPYAGFETRIVPENITLLPKTATQTTGGNSWNERSVVVKKGDNVVSILRELGATATDAKAVATALGPRGADDGLKEGQKLRILLLPVGGTQRVQPIRVIVLNDNAPEFVIALSDTGRYVSVDVQSADTQQVASNEDDDETSSTGTVRLYQSIYETALRQQVPRPLVDELIKIYSYDVDFQRRVQPGDSFEILYPGDEDGSGETKGDILYASLTVGGETKRYYRFQAPDDSVVDYYDETGKSAKKFLVRKPVTTAVMRSGYGWRRHPILGYSKMHTGVDWASPRGTPIYAAGTGTVEIAGWEGGYGRYVRLRHSQGYETAYGHMSAFARGISPGAHVQQGQIIGYVGSTGLSTGAHVHFEILVNGRFVDPMRIKLPRGRSLEGTVLASFDAQRKKVDEWMNRPVGRVAEGSEPLPPIANPRHSPRREALRR